MATLKDVAKLANVDISTVSRALNNVSYVHPETKKRIFDAVEKLSYHPNVLAKGLREGKHRTIAIVVPRFANKTHLGSETGRGYCLIRALTALIHHKGSSKHCLSRSRQMVGTNHHVGIRTPDDQYLYSAPFFHNFYYLFFYNSCFLCPSRCKAELSYLVGPIDSMCTYIGTGVLKLTSFSKKNNFFATQSFVETVKGLSPVISESYKNRVE